MWCSLYHTLQNYIVNGSYFRAYFEHYPMEQKYNISNYVAKVIHSLDNIIIQVVHAKSNSNFSLSRTLYTVKPMQKSIFVKEFSLSKTPFMYLVICRTFFLKIFKIKINDMTILRGALYFISCRTILLMDLISEHISSTIQWNKNSKNFKSIGKRYT